MSADGGFGDEGDALPRTLGAEAAKGLAGRARSGFVAKYLSGPAILDIGYRGYGGEVEPIVPHAIGIELDYPGYDGRTLPFTDFSQDAVFSSHCLEHIEDYRGALRDWFRVLKVGGYLVIAVPHKFLYERKTALPSIWNADHKRFYTPASLLSEIEQSLEPNTYRVRHLADNDDGFDYGIPPQRHAGGCYEVELVAQRIAPPFWTLLPPVEPEPDTAAGTGSDKEMKGPGPGARLGQRVVLKAWSTLPSGARQRVPERLRRLGRHWLQ
jgi:SAM-dependent methyltransferase